MNIGLRESDIQYIKEVLRTYPEIEYAWIFGSRAKGNYKPGSDIDLAIDGENVNFTILATLHAELEGESPMPYMFDIVDFRHTTNKELKEHIERRGILIYKKDKIG